MSSQEWSLSANGSAMFSDNVISTSMLPNKGSFVTFIDHNDLKDTALVTKVNEDHSLNLTVFMDGNLSFKKNVFEGHDRGQWEW